MKSSKQKLWVVGLICVLGSLMSPSVSYALTDSEETEDYAILYEIIKNEFKDEKVSTQGETVVGVRESFITDKKEIAVILTACGSQNMEFDAELLAWLADEKIHVSLFADRDWLMQYRDQIKQYRNTETIQFENHGLECRELLSSGDHAEQFPKGTKNLEEVFVELEKNARHVERLTGRLPYFYRAGGGQYDDVSVKVAQVLGYEVVAGSIRLEKEEHFTAAHVKENMLNAESGDVLVVPLNQASWKLSLKVPKIISFLRSKKFKIVPLEDVSFQSAK